MKHRSFVTSTHLPHHVHVGYNSLLIFFIQFFLATSYTISINPLCIIQLYRTSDNVLWPTHKLQQARLSCLMTRKLFIFMENMKYNFYLYSMQVFITAYLIFYKINIIKGVTETFAVCIYRNIHLCSLNLLCKKHTTNIFLESFDYKNNKDKCTKLIWKNFYKNQS
jgi:hypothetical protein